MWTFISSNGRLFDEDHQLAATGYSGFEAGKNNPAMQSIHNIGPIPEGVYTIGSPYDTTTHGPYVLALTPGAETDVFGRSGFLIHGDSIKYPGTASHGCLIFPRAIRERIWQSGDHLLKVQREESF